jgi:hypothetical protein
MFNNLKKLFLFLIIILLSSNVLTSAPLNTNQVQIVLKKFLLSKNNVSNNILITYPVEIDLNKLNDIQSVVTSPDLYVFKIGKKGFAIMSADDKAEAILAYSEESNIDLKNMPPQLEWMLESYKEQIRFITSNSSNPKSDSWDNILNNKFHSIAAGQVNPLMSTTWNQAPYYNDKCPVDPSSGQKSVAGCVATAMSQIMKFWNYPTKGAGSHSYNHKSIGNVTANFGTTTYNWTGMLDDVQGPNSAVATLMFHCGVAVDMDYSSNSSGSQGNTLVSDAFINYFGYGGSTRFVEKKDYSTSVWNDMIKAEITQQRPIYYQGYGSNGGHAWVIDGYDNSGLFHINWGWGGQSNGYFALNAMNPPGLGIGGGGGGFNFGHSAVIGIEGGSGPAPGAYKLEMAGDIVIDPNPILEGQPFTVNTNFINNGSGVFKGTLGAFLGVVQGQSVQIQDVIDTSIVKTLNPTKTFGVGGITFSSKGVSLKPGSYIIVFVSKTETTSWAQILSNANTTYPFTAQISIVSYDNPIVLNSAIKPAGDKMYVNTATTISTNIKNNDKVDFDGDFSLHLFNATGSVWIQELTTLSNIQIDMGTSKDLVFNIPALNVSLGSYLIVAYDRPKGKTNWNLIKAGTFSNPFSIVLETAPIKADKYEPNDLKTTPTNIKLTLNNDKATFRNDSLTIHTSSDIDYFQFVTDYTGKNQVEVDINIYDSQNPNGPNTFTLDAGANYLLNSEQSSVYTGKIPTFTMNGTDTILLKGVPMSKGKLGNYSLEVKMKVLALNDVDEDINKISIKPNPAKDFITISNTLGLDDLVLVDTKGSIVLKINAKGKKEINVNISDIANGTYLLQNNDSKTIDKFIISR